MSYGAGHRPVRTCIVCGKKRSREELVRLVLKGEDVVIDKKKIMPGRGAYVCRITGCLEMAEQNDRGCLSRAFRSSIRANFMLDV
jgi:predicted RNA-binding protein YlxR (DUF448 family)